MCRGDFELKFRIMRLRILRKRLRILRKRNTLSGNYDWRGRYCYKKWNYNLWNCDSVHCIESDPIGSSTDLVAAAAASMAAASVFLTFAVATTGVSIFVTMPVPTAAGVPAFAVIMPVSGAGRIAGYYDFPFQQCFHCIIRRTAHPAVQLNPGCL